MAQLSIIKLDLPPPPNRSDFDFCTNGEAGKSGQFSWDTVLTLADDPFFRVDVETPAQVTNR